MAKAIGLIGNYTGKLGNTVGYNLKDSNNKQTQGVRVYQPVVKNPRTAGQAEQRAKLAPVNATYRLLKDIIDRGQEGVAYGNKSRLKWLKDTLKSFNGPWFEKGADITMPVLCPISSGSLVSLTDVFVLEFGVSIRTSAVETTGELTMGDVFRAVMAKYPSIVEGDQLTAVGINSSSSGLNVIINSLIVDTTSTDPAPENYQIDNIFDLIYDTKYKIVAGAVIVSREGNNGEHLRSSESLISNSLYDPDILTPAAKAAAIASYMSQGANTDWAEESIM